MSKTPKRPRDPNQLAKLVVDLATGEAQDAPTIEKNPAAVELGRLGGFKGGKARADKLSSEQRTNIARKAAQVRYGHASDLGLGDGDTADKQVKK